MRPIGYCVLIRLALFERTCRDRSPLVDSLLSAKEKALWTKCVTEKRRVEFLGGRVAGKLAALMDRLAAGFEPLNWRDVEILPTAGGVPVCRHADQLCHPVSISHTKHFALAVASLSACQVSVDMEENNWRDYPLPDMFSTVELSQIADPQTARLRWTLKEMYGKLTGRGVLGYTHSVHTLSHENSLWLGVPATSLPAKQVMLSTGHWRTLAVSIGVSSRRFL